MPLVDAVCPHCGAPLKVNPDAKTLTCRYCGNEFVVQDAITNINIKDSKVTNVFNGATVYINNGEAKPQDENEEEEYVDLNIFLAKTYYDTFSVVIDGECIFSSNKKGVQTIKIRKGYHNFLIEQSALGFSGGSTGVQQQYFKSNSYILVANKAIGPFEWWIADDLSENPDEIKLIQKVEELKKK